MPKGGARAVSGPAPDPNALSRDRPGDQATWTALPADGRDGDPPEFPLLDCTLREDTLWRVLWAKPQATQWARLGLELEAALYVRRLAEAEAPGSSVALSTLVRQLGEALGLSAPGMLRLRWRIGPVVIAAAVTGRAAPKPAARRSSRSRLKVVADGEAGG